MYVRGTISGIISINQRRDGYIYNSGKNIFSTDTNSPIYKLRFSRDSTKLAATVSNGYLYIYYRKSDSWSTTRSSYLLYPFSISFDGSKQLAVGRVNSTDGLVQIEDFIAINCSSDPNSTGVNDSRATCACLPGYSYIGAFCGLVNCSSPFESYSADTNANSTACNCIEGFYWNTDRASCVRNCSADVLSTGKNYDDESCYCLLGTDWIGSSCVLNCEGLNNSNQTSNGSNGCNCDTGFIYDFRIRQCVRDCVNINNSQGFNPNNLT